MSFVIREIAVSDPLDLSTIEGCLLDLFTKPWLQTEELKRFTQLLTDLLDTEWDVNTPLPDGSFVLHYLQNYPHFLELILTKGAETSLKDANDRNAFFYFTSLSSIQLLVKYTEDLSILKTRDKGQLTAPLYLAIQYLQEFDELIQSIEYLISLGAPIDLPIDNSNKDAKYKILHELAKFDQRVQLLALFAKHGCDVNALDSSNKTPIHYAISEKRYKQIINLINLGATLDSKASISCIDALRHFSNADSNLKEDMRPIAEYLLEKTDLKSLGWSQLHFAVYLGDPYWIEKYVKKDQAHLQTPLSCPNFYRAPQTPLSLSLDNPLSVLILLENGARPDLETRDQVKKMPQLALQALFFEIYRFLPAIERYRNILSLLEEKIEEQQKMVENNLSPESRSKKIQELKQLQKHVIKSYLHIISLKARCNFTF